MLHITALDDRFSLPCFVNISFSEYVLVIDLSLILERIY